ncbi:hypothetical protein TH53_18750 [Pedobacter lusitanus]|uniref:YD repeat-containing protein n=1 Tax=Pedobacter lusitanus TaxID=1503925 RepID=A0A0D0GI08_9SPHI|nr:hypothetical protein [Pedobacter lusitanus]KIO75760.1 hypothetical protein TH53_18750 [Pedobacter lusitanus]
MKKNSSRIYYLVIFAFISLLTTGITSSTYAQKNNENGVEVPNILSPSPTASELGKFAIVGNSLSTGAANSHVELFTYKTKHLSLPIGIDYSSTGLKVDKVPSRTGMDWALSAGGVISRTVYGSPDGDNAFAIPPADFPNTAGEPLKTYLNSVISSRYDTQPDIFTFSFPGYSGKFIIYNDVIKKLDQNNLQITGNMNDGFFIRTPDGVLYTFDAVEASAAIASSNVMYRSKINNAWFLSSITHPLGDQINLVYAPCQFTYVASKSNAYIYFDGLIDGSCNNCPNIPSKEEITTIINYGQYVSEINSNSTFDGKIKFTYAPRTDLKGDFYLTDVTYKDLSDVTLKKASFTYADATDRFYLKKLAVQDQVYNFDYYKLSALPSRLSYAQDHYGYFNGKNNASMIPKPLDAAYLNTSAPGGFGDRNPDANFSVTGMLRKITYPTGGVDSLEYEANTIYANTTMDCNVKESTFQARVSGSAEFKEPPNVYTSKPFKITCQQSVFVNIGCVPRQVAADGRPLYPLGNYLVIGSVRNIATGETVSGESLQAGAGQHKTGNLNLSPGDYEIVLKVQGDSGGSMNFEYYTGKPAFDGNIEVAGLRLKRVLSVDPVTQQTKIKKFYYGDLTTGKSSGKIYNAKPSYDSNIIRYTKCSTPGEQSGIFFLFSSCAYTKFSSTPNFSAENLSGNHIYYTSVTESIGENFEGGGTKHNFNLYLDGYPALIAGYLMYGGPISNSGVYSQALEANLLNFKKVDGTIIPVSETKTRYKSDPRLMERTKFFAIQAEPTSEIVNTSLPAVATLPAYKGINVAQYELSSAWVYADSVTTTTYDPSGGNPIVSGYSNVYNNTSHQLISSVKKYGSDKKIIQTDYLYPQDNITGLSAEAQSGKQQLINQYNISPVLDQSETVSGTLTAQKRVNYKSWSTSVTAPESIQIYAPDKGLEERVRFYAYDAQGNVLEQGLTNGQKTSYLWSYDGHYPIAEIKDISYADLKTKLGSSTITTFSSQTPGKAAIDSFLSPLKPAYFSSFSYKTFGAIESTTDPKGNTAYYQYDTYQRLISVKDQYGNIIKTVNYHYTGK